MIYGTWMGGVSQICRLSSPGEPILVVTDVAARWMYHRLITCPLSLTGAQTVCPSFRRRAGRIGYRRSLCEPDNALYD
jgi:hypothetical protein